MNQKLDVMFDTNIYDQLFDLKPKNPFEFEEILKSIKTHTVLYITHIQYDELEKISVKDPKKHKKVMEIVEHLNPTKVATVSAVYEKNNKSRKGFAGSSWDEAGWGSTNNFFDQLWNGNDQHIADALSAETAAENGFTFITNDRDLKNKSAKIGLKLKCLNFEEFIELLKNR